MYMEIPITADNSEEEIKDPPSPPHESLFLVLTYLPLFELLAMTEVCRSLRDAINTDILPWLSITVDRPLNIRISDDILMQISSKANGRLRKLALMNCPKITDEGLLGVIANNLHIDKLYLPACTGLTPEGVIRAVKTLTERNHKLLSLSINGICNINKEHLETLRFLIGVDDEHQKQRLPNLYHEYKRSSTYRHDETSPSIDTDICPKCNETRMVFDCARDTCERKGKGRECRGCYLCILWCEECGRCLGVEEQWETACADFLCTDCWLQLPKCSFCNKPYCNQHVDLRYKLPGSSGFVCDVCHSRFIGNSHHLSIGM